MSAQPALQRDADLRESLAQSERANKALTIDLANAETELRALRRERNRLKTELEKARGQNVTQQDALRVFDHWCQRFGKKRGTKFGEKRQGKVRARMREGFTADDLCKAIDGCHAAPYQLFAKHVSRPNPQATRRTDLDYICQDEAQVERFMEIADAGPEDRREAKVVPIKRVEPRCALDLADQLEHTHGLVAKQAAGYGATRFMAQCPAHEDRSPSLSITELNDGRVLLNCFAGCDTEAILNAVGWEWGHIMGGGSTAAEREAQYAGGGS